MFALDLSPTFRAPVKFTLPTEDGKRLAHEFTGVFQRLTVEQSRALADRAKAGGWTDDRLASELLVGWDDIQSGGAALPVTPENKARLFNVVGMADAVLRAHRLAVDDAAAGN